MTSNRVSSLPEAFAASKEGYQELDTKASEASFSEPSVGKQRLGSAISFRTTLIVTQQSDDE